MEIDLHFNLYLETYVTNLFLDHPDRQYPYHNLEHTRKVVANCREISQHYSLSESDQLVLTIGAWFHDVGHLYTTIELHERESVARMYDFIREVSIPAEEIKKIENCILSTRVHQKPATLLEEILCDADLYHLGTDEFFLTNEQVRKEMEMRTGIKSGNWIEESLHFLLMHKFYTSYCNEKLNPGKEINIRNLRYQLGY
jgi:HD superfamily phosphodiesterase